MRREARAPALILSTGLTAIALATASGGVKTLAAKPTKVVLLWSKEHHPNEACCRLFKHCLANAANVPPLKVETYEAWPSDLGVLEDAATTIVYGGCEVKRWNKPHHFFAPARRPRREKPMEKGVGLVCIHAPLYAMRKTSAPLLLEWLGGYYDQEGYGSRHGAGKDIVLTCAAPDHPTARGWKQITLPRNELYHNLRFA